MCPLVEESDAGGPSCPHDVAPGIAREDAARPDRRLALGAGGHVHAARLARRVVANNTTTKNRIAFLLHPNSTVGVAPQLAMLHTPLAVFGNEYAAVPSVMNTEAV